MKECRPSTCVNGTCIDATCACDPAYEGLQCDTLSSAKFISQLWHNSILCQSGSAYLDARVEASQIQEGAVDIYNVYRHGDKVMAIARQDSLVAPKQVYGNEYISGSGLFSHASFTLEFVVETTTGTQTTCTAVFSK